MKKNTKRNSQELPLWGDIVVLVSHSGPRFHSDLIFYLVCRSLILIFSYIQHEMAAGLRLVFLKLSFVLFVKGRNSIPWTVFLNNWP